MDATQHAIESVRAEIDRLVAERHELRQTSARPDELDANRARLVSAQSRLSSLLIQQQRHLHRPTAA
jgi:hypothetical protein